MLAHHEAIPGARLDEELGVPRAAVDVLIGKATNLDLPLIEAAAFNRVEYVRLLLDAGADPGTQTLGAPRWRKPSTTTPRRSSTC